MASLLLSFPLAQTGFSSAWSCLLWTFADAAVPACFLPYICNLKNKKKTKKKTKRPQPLRNSPILLLFLFLIQGKEKMAADSSLLDRPPFEYGQGDNMKKQISFEGHLRRKQRARLHSEPSGSVRGTPRSPFPSQNEALCRYHNMASV